MSHTAFYSGKPVVISLSGKRATAYIGVQPSIDDPISASQSIDVQGMDNQDGDAQRDGKTDQLELDQLFFQPQSFQMSKNGFPSVDFITYRVRNRQFELDIVQHIYGKN